MGKISEEQKSDVTYYLNTLDEKYDYKYKLMYKFDDILNTRAEVDAVMFCIRTIEESYPNYNYSLVSAPRDPARRSKAFAAISDDPVEVEYMNQVEPLFSQTMIIKHQIIDDVTFILKDANIGKNRRKKIIPMLISNILMGGEN